MRDFDSLPPELRLWLADAVLPWRPKSVYRVYARTLARNPDKAKAIEKLGTIERKLIAKDGRRIWGGDHPYLMSTADL